MNRETHAAEFDVINQSSESRRGVKPRAVRRSGTSTVSNAAQYRSVYIIAGRTGPECARVDPRLDATVEPNIEERMKRIASGTTQENRLTSQLRK